jgi:DNA-binding transcriptional LysR family regulator
VKFSNQLAIVSARDDRPSVQRCSRSLKRHYLFLIAKNDPRARIARPGFSAPPCMRPAGRSIPFPDQYRLTVDGRAFPWPLLRNGKTRRISVDGRVMVNDAHLATRAAVDGLGIALTTEALAGPFLRSGQLVQVLKDCSPSFEGFFVYYPGHRQVPTGLRAFIDMIRAARGSVPSRSSLKNPFTKD